MAESARSGNRRGEALTAEDTIFALSSGAPPAALAIVRISGPEAAAALKRLSGRGLPEARRAHLVRLRDADDLTIDEALALWFPGSNSATGEDIVELHLHGARAVVAAALCALSAIPGLRPAEPGEFTRRAFANGRYDLAQAEALGDLLAAETEGQRRNAVLQFEGGLRRLIDAWQRRVVGMAAAVDASLDFSDEEDVEEAEFAQTVEEAAALAVLIARHLHDPPAERLRDGLRVVIAGEPNAGKSTLLNALVGREAAIATPIAGTTRDLIEVPVVLNGIAMILIDTAGLRDDASDVVEEIGIGRAQTAIASADLVIALDDSVVTTGPVIRVAAKSDLKDGTPTDLPVSAQTGEGVPALREAIAKAASSLLPPPDCVALNARHRAALCEAIAALRAIDAAPEMLVVAEHLRQARLALDRVIGGGDTESVLDEIFGRFCIGK